MILHFLKKNKEDQTSFEIKKVWVRSLVVAQLVDHLLLIPEVRGSNPVIGKNLYWTFVYCQLYWKDENKEEKMPGMAHFLKKYEYGWTIYQFNVKRA